MVPSGVKVTAIRQEAPAASVAPQGFVEVTSAKSAALAPPRRMLLMFSVALPVLESMAVRLLEVTPCVVFGKLMLELSAATGAGAVGDVDLAGVEVMGEVIAPAEVGSVACG